MCPCKITFSVFPYHRMLNIILVSLLWGAEQRRKGNRGDFLHCGFCHFSFGRRVTRGFGCSHSSLCTQWIQFHIPNAHRQIFCCFFHRRTMKWKRKNSDNSRRFVKKNAKFCLSYAFMDKEMKTAISEAFALMLSCNERFFISKWNLFLFSLLHFETAFCKYIEVCRKTALMEFFIRAALEKFGQHCLDSVDLDCWSKFLK